MKLIFVLFALVAQSCSVFGVRSEEGPEYTVRIREGKKEIRDYDSYIVAQTTVKGDYKASQEKAFNILADYIFGKNRSKQEIAMTAPVTQNKEGGQKISMTSPVTHAEAEEGWTMRFMMPSKYQMHELPEPLDERIELVEVPARKLAVIRYSGFNKQKTNQKKAQELKNWLDTKEKYSPASEAYFAGYDPPWTIPFLRRNEMMMELE